MEEKTYVIKVKVYKDTLLSNIEKQLEKLKYVTDIELLEEYND